MSINDNRGARSAKSTTSPHSGGAPDQPLWDHKYTPDEIAQGFDQARRDVGRVNIAVFGLSGVGKSTLINKVFGKELAKTGRGRPVTERNHLYVHESGTLGILDSPGLEIGRDADTILNDLRLYIHESRQLPADKQIHVVWYCIHGRGRIQPFEEAFIRELNAMKLPVVTVLTQVDMKADGAYRDQSLQLKAAIEDRKLPTVSGSPVLVSALGGPPKFISHGLTRLIEVTESSLPEGVRAALTAAQEVDLRRKRRMALAVIATAATSSAAAAFVPVPGGDVASIVTVQLAMIGGISTIYKIDMDYSVLAGILGPTLARQGARLAAGSLAKFVPALGEVVGGTVNAGISSVFTALMGAAWMATCEGIARKEFDVKDLDSLKRSFNDEFEKGRERGESSEG